MAQPSSDVAFTTSVKAAQERLGSRGIYEGVDTRGGFQSVVTDELAAFLAQRDSLYLGTASAEGRPYIQHRGGKPGFLKVLDAHTLGFADFSGNRQYISIGNLDENAQAFLFLMDYANRRRIKIWGRARFVEDDAELLAAVHDADYEAQPERALVFEVEAWDRNCPQHIPRLYSEEAVTRREQALQDRITELETRLAT